MQDISIRFLFLFLSLFLFLLVRPLSAQGSADNESPFTRGGYDAERGELRLMWYNVENLFHPSDDSLAGDDEFTPMGVRAWSYKRYEQKLAGLARVIVAAGRWQPPAVVGLCEVEGPQVLEELVSHPILASYQYSYLHGESPDHRGMDVACIFRPERFKPVSWQFIAPVAGEGFDQTRELLYLRGVWGRKDTIGLILVHFISRYRGAGATANYRREQAAQLAGLIDSIGCRSPENLVVAAGDFNDDRGGWSLEPLSDFMILPSAEEPSYKYRGAWSGIDLFLVSGGLDKYRIRAAVFKLPQLLVPDLTYGGVKPFRTYVGYQYAGGYSDHLPVLLDISRSPF